MSHVQQFLQVGRALAGASGECVLATLVSVTGSSFRRPGARMLIKSDGEVVGGISAGCLEDEICAKCFEWTNDGTCVKEFHVGGAEDELFGWGSGCKGTLSVLLQRVDSNNTLMSKMLRAIDARETCIMTTIWSPASRNQVSCGTHFVLIGDAQYTDVSPELRDLLLTEARLCLLEKRSRSAHYIAAQNEFFVLWEVVEPPVQLCVFGAGEGVARLLDCAREMGWNTLVCDKRSEMYNRMHGLRADRIFECVPGELPDEMACDARTAAVVMTHHFADDFSIVGALLNSAIPYVGVLGGRARNQRLKEELARDFSPEHFERLFAPIGLNLGAEEAPEIALAITSEILAFMNGRRPGHLKDEKESIHKPVSFDQTTLVHPPVAARHEKLCQTLLRSY